MSVYEAGRPDRKVGRRERTEIDSVRLGSTDGKDVPGNVPPREAEMISLRWEGHTLDEISKRFALSRERVRQLIEQYGGPSAAEVRRLQDERSRAAETRLASLIGRAVRTALESLGPSSAEQVAEHSGYTNTEVARYWPADLRNQRLWTAGGSQTTWTDDQVLTAIREAAIYEFPLTTSAYQELVTVGQVIGPSMPRIWQRFGSWTAACEAAGVVAGRALRQNYETRWSDADILDIVRRYLEDPEAPNSFHRYDEWKRVNAPDGPSGASIRNRLGPWTQVKRLALTSGESDA